MKTLEKLKRDYIHQILNEYNFDIKKTASILNVHSSTIYREIEKDIGFNIICKFLKIDTKKKRSNKRNKLNPIETKNSKLNTQQDKGGWVRINLSYIKNYKLYNDIRIAGCYVIFIKKPNKNELVYIGSSNNIHQRLREHLNLNILKKQKHPLLIVKIRKDKTKYEHLTLEARLIDRLKPKYNKQYNNIKEET